MANLGHAVAIGLFFVLFAFVFVSFADTPYQDGALKCQNEVLGGIDARIYEQISAQAGSRAQKDVGVYKLDISSAMTASTTHYPGQLCNISVIVMNYGAQVPPLTIIDVICSVNDGFHNSTLQSKTYSQGLGAYQQGIDNVTISFQFAPPLYPPADYAYPHTFTVVATVAMGGDEVASNNQKIAMLGVMKADFAPVMGLGSYDKAIGRPDPTGWDPVHTKVGATLTVPFTLFNYGSGQDCIRIEPISRPTNWSVSSFTQILLDDKANTTDDLSLIVSVSKNRQDALKNFDYIVTLKAYSLNYPVAETTMDIHFTIDFSGGMELQVPYSEKWATPGSIIYIDVKIMNKGNGKDSFYSRLEDIGDSAKISGWVAYVYSGGLTPAIGRDEDRTVTIRVSVPPNALKGSHCKITLTASSNTDTSVVRSTNIEVYASKLYAPVLEAQQAVYEIYPGCESMLYFNLTNNGNGRDPSIDLRVGKLPLEWVSGLDESQIPSSGLGYRSTAEIGMKLILPDSVPAKRGYSIIIEAWAGDPLSKLDQCTLNVDVLTKFGAQVNLEEQVESGYIGGLVEGSASIRNRGNADDTFRLSASLRETQLHPGWIIETSEKEVNLSANMTRTIKIYASIPLDAPADPNPATASIFEGYYIDIIAASSSDPKNATASAQMVVKVNPSYSFKLECADRYAKVSSDRTDVLPFIIEVNNTGNVKDIVDFFVQEDDKWHPSSVELLTMHKFLPHRERREVVVNIEPKKGQAPGRYVFDLIATSRGDKALTQTINITIDMVSFDFKIDNIRLYNLSLEEMMAQGKYNKNSGYEIVHGNKLMLISDIMNVGSDMFLSGLYGDLIVTLYDGNLPVANCKFNVTYLEPYSLKNRTFTAVFVWKAEPGTEEGKLHQLNIKVDPQDRIPEKNENDNVKSVLVTVYTPMVGNETHFNPLKVVFYIGLPLVISIIIVIFGLMTWNSISNTRVTIVDTGYTLEGEYKPFAKSYDAFEGEQELDKEEIEIEYDPEHPYAMAALPYTLTGMPTIAPVPTPFALLPPSPYGIVSNEIPAPLKARAQIEKQP